MPNIVKMEINEAHNIYRTDMFVFETDGCEGTLYDGPYLYRLSKQQVQRILAFAQETDLVGTLNSCRGLISRDYYVLTFDDGTSLTSTGGGYDMTKLLRQMTDELGEPLNKAEAEKRQEEIRRSNESHYRTSLTSEFGKQEIIGGFSSKPRTPEKTQVEPWDCRCGTKANTDVFCHNCGGVYPDYYK